MMGEVFATLFFVVYTLTILGIIVVIITDNRNPLKTVPWILVLTLAPGVGLIFYFFFGQNLSKRRILSRRMRKRITTQLRETAGDDVPMPEEYRTLMQLLSNTAHAVPLFGSRLTPYTSGAEKMDALIEELSLARHHIHLQYYILSDDEVGNRLKNMLIRKAREGVKIRILYDDMGCHGVPKSFFDEMRREGIEVSAFLHVHFPLLTSKFNYRNHRKIVVIDGRVGFVGGMNIADRYVKGVAWGRWRDTHFKVEGRGVAGLQASFLSDWSATTKQDLPMDEEVYYPRVETFSRNVMQIVPGGPLGKWRVLLQADSYAIARARHKIWIQTPYYLPSDVLNSSLQEAALAGVDVRLMLPERADVRVVNLCTHSFLDDMMKAGVKIYFYKAGFLHSKLMIIDNDLVIAGSANMDFRSFEHNFEVNAFIYDAEFTQQMTAIYEEDCADCHVVTPNEWFHRPRMQRFLESLTRLFAPLM